MGKFDRKVDRCSGVKDFIGCLVFKAHHLDSTVFPVEIDGVWVEFPSSHLVDGVYEHSVRIYQYNVSKDKLLDCVDAVAMDVGADFVYYLQDPCTIVVRDPCNKHRKSRTDVEVLFGSRKVKGIK